MERSWSTLWHGHISLGVIYTSPKRKEDSECLQMDAALLGRVVFGALFKSYHFLRLKCFLARLGIQRGLGRNFCPGG